MSSTGGFTGGLVPRRRLLAAAPAVAAATLVLRTATAGPKGVHLPADEAPHHEPTEWWYFNGHVAGVDHRGARHHYGFEYVTFQFLGVAPAPVYIANFAVTDLTRRTFQYRAEEDSYPVPDTPGKFALHTGPWSMTGRRGHDHLAAELPGYRLGLTLESLKPAALHGRNGVIDFGPFGTSEYYSWTDLRVRGTVVDHGVPVRVTGLSWMDHQWGDFTFASGGGWDWFSIQLTNGQQYMLYFIRRKNGVLAATAGTRVERDGRTVHLRGAAVAEHPRGTWTSKSTGITYPAGWTLTIPGGTLTVSPDLRDQELDLRSAQGVVYWEGDVAVNGTLNGVGVSGVGYTEINPPGQA